MHEKGRSRINIEKYFRHVLENLSTLQTKRDTLKLSTDLEELKKCYMGASFSCNESIPTITNRPQFSSQYKTCTHDRPKTAICNNKGIFSRQKKQPDPFIINFKGSRGHARKQRVRPKNVASYVRKTPLFLGQKMLKGELNAWNLTLRILGRKKPWIYSEENGSLFG